MAFHASEIKYELRRVTVDSAFQPLYVEAKWTAHLRSALQQSERYGVRLSVSHVSEASTIQNLAVALRPTNCGWRIALHLALQNGRLI